VFTKKPKKPKNLKTFKPRFFQPCQLHAENKLYTANNSLKLSETEIRPIMMPYF